MPGLRDADRGREGVDRPLPARLGRGEGEALGRRRAAAAEGDDRNRGARGRPRGRDGPLPAREDLLPPDGDRRFDPGRRVGRGVRLAPRGDPAPLVRAGRPADLRRPRRPPLRLRGRGPVRPRGRRRARGDGTPPRSPRTGGTARRGGGGGGAFPAAPRAPAGGSRPCGEALRGKETPPAGAGPGDRGALRRAGRRPRRRGRLAGRRSLPGDAPGGRVPCHEPAAAGDPLQEPRPRVPLGVRPRRRVPGPVPRRGAPRGEVRFAPRAGLHGPGGPAAAAHAAAEPVHRPAAADPGGTGRLPDRGTVRSVARPHHHQLLPHLLHRPRGRRKRRRSPRTSSSPTSTACPF